MWLWEGKSKPLALPDRIVYQPTMRADHIPFRVKKIAGLRCFSGCTLDKSRIIAIRHETNILAVRLARIAERGAFRQFPSLLLGQPAKREFHTRQLLLRHGVQHIALILMVI